MKQDNIKFLHIRVVDAEGTLQPRGGVTIAYLITKKDILLAVARCRLPGCSIGGVWGPGDTFCYRTGRSIAANRLRHAQPYEVLKLNHPIQETIVGWFAEKFFESCAITVIAQVAKDGKRRRWVSTFEINEDLTEDEKLHANGSITETTQQPHVFPEYRETPPL